MMKLIFSLSLALLLSFTASAGTLEDAEAAFEKGDYPIAFQLYYTLAIGNNANAQDMLGTMYILGVGVKQNFAQGVLWLTLAEANGSEDSADTRMTLIEQNKAQIIRDIVEKNIF